MRRDMGLVRGILATIETADNNPDNWIEDLGIEADKNLISYHIQVLSEAGLIEAQELNSGSGYSWKAKRLTWEGHEFLDASKDDRIWKKAISQFGEDLTGVPFDILLSFMKAKIKESLNIQ